MSAVVLLLLLSCCSVRAQEKTILERLEDALYKGFDDVWPFLKSFPTPTDLRVNKMDLFRGIANKGPWTDYCLAKIIDKVLKKEAIRVLIIGESISAGANLGCRNNKRTFHYGLASWWLKTITAATGSRLIRHQIAVGGVATNYFDRCWKEYLYLNETFDLVLWEFAFNDADANQGCKSIERFTRSIGNLKSTPGVIFVTFFRKTFFEQYTSKTAKNPCDVDNEDLAKRHEEHEETIAKVTSYYGVTSLDLERTVCSALERNSSSLSFKQMFSTDHPSFLAHAQMTFILIHYLRASFATIVRAMKTLANSDKKTRLQFRDSTPKKILPSPLFLSPEETDVAEEPVCWTAVLPNFHIKPKHDLFDLTVKYSKGFTKLEKMDWRDADEKRFDSTSGFQTTKANETIRFDFTVPTLKEKINQRISLAIRNKFFGGKVQVTVRSYTNKTESNRRELTDVAGDIFDSSTKFFSGLNVFDISKQIQPGKSSLVVKTLTGGIMICGIVIS